MKTLSVTALLLASALSLAGCNKGAAPVANNTAAPAAPKPADNTAAPAPATNETAGGDEASSGPTGTVGTARQNFSILNSTGHTVLTVKVSPTSETSWGPDILGANVLRNGQTLEVSFDRNTSECNYDIQATYDDGDTTDMRGVNLCQVGTVNLVAQ